MYQGEPKSRSNIVPIGALAVRWWAWTHVTTVARHGLDTTHCSTSTAWRHGSASPCGSSGGWSRSAGFPYLKIGRFVRFDPDEIERWLDAARVEMQPERGARAATAEAAPRSGRWLTCRSGSRRRVRSDGTSATATTPGASANAASSARSTPMRFGRAVETDLLRGDWIDPRRGKEPFEVWASTWLETLGTRKPKTRESYESILHRHLLPRFGATPIGSIDYPLRPRHIVAELQRRGLGTGTVRNIRDVLAPRARPGRSARAR